jgi:hypothetical protein
MEAWVILFTMRPWRLPRAFMLLSEWAISPGSLACILITLRNAFRSASTGGETPAPEIFVCKTWSILLKKTRNCSCINLWISEHYYTDSQLHL